MKKTSKSIEIDCVELMHNGAEEIQKKLQGKNTKEVLKFWEEKNREFLKLKNRIIEKSRKTA